MRKVLAVMLLICLSRASSANEDINRFFPLDGFYADARYRYEHVEQDNLTEDADASTLRLKVGYKTGIYKDFQALAEVEAIANIGSESYNDTVNGKVRFPVIADPEGVELNQLWLSWAGLPDTKIQVGRQAINLDNQRFIGSVGWRQNDQTFDAVAVTNNSIPKLNLLYSHVRNVNRVFSGEHPLGDLDTETHIARASYSISDWLNLAGYGYWLDFDLIPGFSSKTLGLRATGEKIIDDSWKFFYEAEVAEQDNHAGNPNNYNATYYHLSPGIKKQNLTLQAGFESLEGNGTSAFSTPLATLHAFNGWADQFLNTPANGLEDVYGKISYKFDNIHPWIDSTELTGTYHWFAAENTDAEYGDELDLQLTRPIKIDDIGWSEGASITLKYADYDAEGFGADTEKFWMVFQVKF